MGTIVSGMRPTGRLHLGHLHGALRNWVRLQELHRCYFFVADWHALTTGPVEESLLELSREMVVDWLAAGLDPNKVTLFRQSQVPEHAELFLLLAMVTPTPWLVRNPTVKEQARDLGLLRSEDESEVVGLPYGLLGYPVLQAADVLLYKADAVPVGIDQAPHIELTREIARRFNGTYRPVFPEPAVLLTEAPKLPGTDGRKMSKSLRNAVFLSDAPEDVTRKLEKMATDPRRVRRNDPGEPEDCPAFRLHRIYCTPEEIDYVVRGCRTAGIGCLECKRIMIRHVLEDLEPIRKRREEWQGKPREVDRILEAGARAAAEVAGATMREVRRAVGLAEEGT
ncbi:MAG: tryptophan--tRNA ligase [Candidatus Binatia bacterium]|nr:MAG: tryptophan--tRNA ligase [Candidatus Binatia bacterium]